MSTYLPYTHSLFPYLNTRNRDRGLNSFFENFFDELAPNIKETSKFDFSPSVDIHESDNKLDIIVEVPGVERDDLNVNVKDKVLTISGTKKSVIEEANYKETHAGTFERSLRLSDEYDVEAIDVKLNKGGILKIAIPKKATKNEKTIEIKDE